MCFNVALLLKAKDCDRIIVAGNPVNMVDPWGLIINGTLSNSKILPHELNIKVLNWGFEFDYPTKPGKIPGLGPRAVWIDMLVGGKIRFLIHCQETECNETKREGYIETSINIPRIIPYTYHQEIPLVSWMYSIPYNLLRLAVATEPLLTAMAKANGINIPLICKQKKQWQNDMPFSWSDEIPLAP